MKEQPDSSTITIGDVNIPYLRYGSAGPPVVMMHATGFQPWQWHPIARNLKNKYQIIAPYFCTHRKPDPAGGSISWLQLAEDLACFCEQLGLEHPYLVGHSMGATLATIAVARFGIQARKLVLIEPIYLPRELYTIKIGVADHPLASKSIKRRNAWQNREEALAYLRSKKMFQQWDEEALLLYITHGMTMTEQECLQLTCPPTNEAALFLGGGELDPWPLLPQIDIPALIVEGSQSENKAFIDLQKASQLFGNGSYLEVKDAGHLIPMEKPAELADRIQAFL